MMPQRLSSLTRSVVAKLIGSDKGPGQPDHDGARREQVLHQPLLRCLAQHLLNDPLEQQRFARSSRQHDQSGVSDYYFGVRAEDCRPRRIFHLLRWGGQLVFTCARPRELQGLLDRYRRSPEFAIDAGPRSVAELCPNVGGSSWFRGPPHFFVARKVLLTPAGAPTDRHSYDVRLVRAADPSREYVVLKQVPDYEQTVERLAQRFENSDRRTIEQSARKLVEKVFPVFLSREAALITILQRDAPEAYRGRFPRVLDMEKDHRRMVQKMRINWLRLGGETLSQVEFARQSAELLHVLHERVGLIHLDLRLDNIVVTPAGVGFVDFGSAVRVGEDFSNTPMLRSLLGEMLSASQIQKDLRRMIKKKKVTSNLFVNSYQKIDKAVDLFYLVLQMNNPHANPDFRGLVAYHRDDAQARSLSRLSRAVLKQPRDGRQPYQSAADVLEGIRRIQQRLAPSPDA